MIEPALPPAPDDAIREIERLLYHEARLLDTGCFDAWLDLFTADAIYWVPSRPGQTDPRGVASIIYEDRGLLTMRVRRLVHPRAHALAPAPRTTHLVSNIELLDVDNGKDECCVGSAFLIVEHRDPNHRIFSGRCTHTLRRVDGVLKIASKRVDLVDCDGLHTAMTIPF